MPVFTSNIRYNSWVALQFFIPITAQINESDTARKAMLHFDEVTGQRLGDLIMREVRKAMARAGACIEAD